MTTKTRYDCLSRLERLGVDYDDAASLRRIAMTLDRWHELECGTGDGSYTQWIERDETTGKPYFTVENSWGRSRWITPDRESGALRRLEKIMSAYPSLVAYVQGDPRGASLYILDRSEIPAGSDLDSCYSRGVAVVK